MYDFMREFAPHLTRERVEAALQAHSRDELDELFRNVELPQL
jgi:LysR family cys regulon transcriptional activator